MTNDSMTVPAPAGAARLDAAERLILGGDLSKLSPVEKISVYRTRCELAGLDYRTQPFAYLRLSGREVLYATKTATDQLAAQHGIIAEIVDQRTEDGVRTVTVRSRTRDGRQTDEVGCVPIGGLKGEQLANALMKAVTKAKRRSVLSLTGLGMMDETEIESIPDAVRIEPPPAVDPGHKAVLAAVVEAVKTTPVPPPTPATKVSESDWTAFRNSLDEGLRIRCWNHAQKTWPGQIKTWRDVTLEQFAHLRAYAEEHRHAA